MSPEPFFLILSCSFLRLSLVSLGYVASVDHTALPLGSFRAIATDLDGTILVDHQHASPRTLTALRTAEERGVLVVVATARPPRWVAPLVDVLGPLGVAVC